MNDDDILDPRFASLIIGHAKLDRLRTSGRLTERPVYGPAAKSVPWSDIPKDRVMRFDGTDESVSVFEPPCGHQNGHALDLQGRVVACEHGGRGVSRLEHDGRWSALATRFDGHRLNSPHDVVVKSEGGVSGSPTRPRGSTTLTKARRPRAKSATPMCSVSILRRAASPRW